MKIASFPLVKRLEWLFEELCDVGVLLFIAAILDCIDALVIAVICQNTGKIPCTENFHGLFFVWKLPFAISRIWDIFLFPLLAAAFLGLSHLVENIEGRGSSTSHPDHPILLDIIGLGLIVGFFGGLIFGIIYAVPLCIVTVLAFSMMLGLKMFATFGVRSFRKMES